MARTTSDTDERLWIESISAFLRFDALGSVAFDRPALGPYLVVVVWYLLDSVVLGYFVYEHSGFMGPLDEPIILLILPGWLFAVWVARRLMTRYHEVVESLPESKPLIADDRKTPQRSDRLLRAVGVPYDSGSISPKAFDRTIPKRLRVLVFVGALLFHVLWLLGTFRYTPENLAWTLDTWGRPVALLRFGLVIPFGNYLIASELVSMFLAVHVVLPGEVIASGRLDFGDPLGYAGLRPVGNLIKWSTLYYVIGLSTFATFFTFSSGIRDPTITWMLTLAGTALAVMMFFGPVYWLHRYMKRAKETKLEDIAATVRTLGPETDDSMFPETSIKTPDHAGEYTHEYIRLRKVESTAEYPVDVAILQEILLILILPFLTNVSSSYAFANLQL